MSTRIPMEPKYKFYTTYVNPFNYFTYERVYQGHYYTPKPNSQLICLPTFIPNFMERPLLYILHLPKFF